jgi:hypothetical protein
LTDQSILASIAQTDDDENVRMAAVQLLTDQSALANIAATARKKEGLAATRLRTVAIERLTSQTLLATIAMTSKSYLRECGEAAVRTLDDQGLLVDVAHNAEEWKTCFLAAKKVVDQSLVQEVYAFVLTDPHCQHWNGWNSFQEEAWERLVDQHVLADIAKSAGNYTFNRGKLYLSKITDQTILADIAQNASHEAVSITALRKLESREIADEIARTSRFNEVRRLLNYR